MVSTGAVGLRFRKALTIEYIASQFEGGCILTVPSEAVFLRAGILGFALIRDGDPSTSSSSSPFIRFRDEGKISVLSFLEVIMLVVGEALPCLRLRVRELLGVLTPSSMSGVDVLCTAVLSELSYSSSLTSTDPSRLNAK